MRVQYISQFTGNLIIVKMFDFTKRVYNLQTLLTNTDFRHIHPILNLHLSHFDTKYRGHKAQSDNILQSIYQSSLFKLMVQGNVIQPNKENVQAIARDLPVIIQMCLYLKSVLTCLRELQMRMLELERACIVQVNRNPYYLQLSILVKTSIGEHLECVEHFDMILTMYTDIIKKNAKLLSSEQKRQYLNNNNTNLVPIYKHKNV